MVDYATTTTTATISDDLLGLIDRHMMADS
jgi:hypothetical protein